MAANGVKTRHKDYDRFAKKWKRVRDVVAGQDEIHGATVAYLPMLVDEDGAEYLKRIARTPFYNATWRTMAAFTGMLFRKPASLEVPAKLEPLLEDVTMSGVSFNNFAQDVTLEDIEISRVGVLVDHPQQVANADGKPLTVAQAEQMGLRPSMTMYKAESIINWLYEYAGNRYILTQVRLLENATVRKNEFEFEDEARIRVLDLVDGKYRVRLFKEDSEEQIGWDIFPQMNGAPLTEIPFYFIGPDGSDSKLTEPVLIDLVDLNIKHYQVSADYEHGCHFTGLPTPVITGLNQAEFDPTKPKETYYIGSASAWVLPTGADAKYLEFSGQGLGALEKNLDRKEAQMAAIGARMLTPEKAGVEAEGTVAMRHNGEHSILGAIAIAVSEGLTKALFTFARWAGIEPTPETVKFEINRDFMPFPMTSANLTALLAIVQAGKMSHEAFFDLLKRGDLHDADTDFETEQARIDANPPMPPPVAGVPGEDEGGEDDDEGKPKPPKPGDE